MADQAAAVRAVVGQVVVVKAEAVRAVVAVADKVVVVVVVVLHQMKRVAPRHLRRMDSRFTPQRLAPMD